MDKKSPHRNKKEAEHRSPAPTDDPRKGSDKKGHDAEAHLRRAEAALREQPEDRRETARQTTPAGKARSQ